MNYDREAFSQICRDLAVKLLEAADAKDAFTVLDCPELRAFGEFAVKVGIEALGSREVAVAVGTAQVRDLCGVTTEKLPS